ncbi:MAG: hypothetical protein AAF664_20930 [Planctomycetota bacterium]
MQVLITESLGGIRYARNAKSKLDQSPVIIGLIDVIDSVGMKLLNQGDGSHSLLRR